MPKPKHNTNPSVTLRFSAAAGTYHRNARIQRRVAKKLLALLPSSPAPARILEIGCGTGVLTKMLSNAFHSGRIDAVDVSRAMTIKARERMAGNRTIKWIIADARHLPKNMKYQLIISNCTLHWITPFQMIIKKLGAMLTPDSTLAFAVMTHGTFAELNASRNRIVPHKPPRVIMPTKNEIKKAVTAANLRILKQKTETIRQKFDSAEKMLKQLHDQGLTGGNIPYGNTVLTRSELSRLTADYEKKYRIGHGVYATFRVFYCVTKKKKLPRRTQRHGEVEVA